MKKNVLNALVYAFVIFLTSFGLGCLIVSLTVCVHAAIISAITLPLALIITIAHSVKNLKVKHHLQ